MCELSKKTAVLHEFKDLTSGRIPFVKLFIWILSFLALFNSTLLASQQSEQKNVLVLFSFRPTFPIASQWDRGIQSVFKQSISPKIVVNIEYLDLMHYEAERYIQILLDILRFKYSKPKPDLIIPVFDSAVDLVLDHGPDLFSGVPIVFGGVESKFFENRSLGQNVTGYLTDNNYTGTLDLMLNLHPDTRQVAVIAGADPVGREWIKACREAFKAYEERVNFTYLIGLPMKALLEKLANLSAHTVVFSLPILQDGAGKKFIGNESLSQITRVSSAPVYSFRDINIGTGIVGGYMSSFEEDGKAVAQLGLRILNGEQPEDIPITQAPTFRYMFDWQQLKRWSIAEDKLPQDSIVKFKELTVWDKYKERIIGAFALIVFQMLIIIYLVYQSRIKRKVEQNYKTVADYTYDWEYWRNADGKFQYVSPSCERICGYSAQDFMDNPSLLRDIIVPEDRATWDEHHCSVQKEMKPEEIHFRIKRPDGEIRWIEHACQPVFDHKGNYQGIRASNRDITTRELYKSETQKLQSELAHMDRVVTVSALTSALAHEINQPLAAIRSYAQAALRFMDKDKPDFDNMRKALEGIVSDNKRAAAVVNRLRDLVKKGTVHRDALEINSVINDVVSLMNSELVLRNASIALDLHPDLPVVQGDSIQLQQLLINLLSNALDAMEDQPVDTRTILISSRYENPNGILVSISDSGEGISSDKIDAVFNAFETTKAQGTGLGLAICKSIVEAHEGKIWAENRSDRGAIFSFSLPSSGSVE